MSPLSPSGTPYIHLVRSAPHGLRLPQRNRLGVLGGAYNPITLAHLGMADTAVDTFDLDEMLFLLPQVPPHKPIFGATLEQRLTMMQLAVHDRPYASVGLSSHGLFIDIYDALSEMYASRPEVFFLTGRDAAERILTWNYEDTALALQQMLTSFQLIVCDRDGAFQLPDDPLLRQYQARIHHCALPSQYHHISSTAVRQRCRQGLPIDDLVAVAVVQYIQEHGLYRE